MGNRSIINRSTAAFVWPVIGRRISFELARTQLPAHGRTDGRTLVSFAILPLTSEHRTHVSLVSREAFTQPPFNLGLADYSNYAKRKDFFHE